MTEIVGDYVEPLELIVPRVIDSHMDGISGALFISGGLLFFVDADGNTVDTTT